jgi:DNA-binding winged helix-turn-helix (wHTH) protein
MLPLKTENDASVLILSPIELEPLSMIYIWSILMHKHFRQIYSFDDFTLDLDRGCLLRSGQEVKLRPKSFEVFKYLVEHHGRLVSKNDLMRAVWTDAIVTDDSLVQCLIEVRRALGDESRRYVKTVPRRGYIFEAQLRESAVETHNHNMKRQL